MGNMFLGFPVPRARIADMIATDAPPAIHKVNHQSGGSDEMNVTGLTGAGGASLPFPDYLYSCEFTTLDGLSDSVFSGASITVGHLYTQLDTDGTSGSRATIRRDPDYFCVPLTWDKNRQFNTQVQFRSFGNANSEFQVGISDPMLGTGFGFVLENGLLKAVCRTGGNQSTHTIEDLTASTFQIERRLRAHKTGASEIKFYVDDVLVHTETVNVPTGTSDAHEIMQIQVRNPAAGSHIWIKISSFSFWQEA